MVAALATLAVLLPLASAWATSRVFARLISDREQHAREERQMWQALASELCERIQRPDIQPYTPTGPPVEFPPLAADDDAAYLERLGLNGAEG
jgi:hypothetical protein